MGVKGKKNFQEYKDIKFANETELEFYKKLETLKLNGKIYDFDFEVEYVFYDESIDWRGKIIQPISHYPDFKIWIDKNNYIIVDTKSAGGFMTDETSVIKRKIWMLTHPEIPYYMISKLSEYLGGCWVESSKGYDFYTKIRSKYKKLYPEENTRKKDCVKFFPENWKFYYDFEDVLGLFYIWNKTLSKKESEKRLKNAKNA